MTIQFVAETNIGNKRQVNEDSLWPPAGPHPYSPDHPYGMLFIVADGMGGHGAGDVASGLAVEMISETYYGLADDYPDIGQRLTMAIQEGHQRIVSEATESPDQRDMGTTVVAVVVKYDDIYEQGEVWIAWAGDSRVYLLRQGQLKQLSRDHSRVWPLIESGQITWDELRFHPDRSKVTNALTARRPDVMPEIQNFSLQPGDQLLLCSDGLTGEVRPGEVEQILNDYPAGRAAQLLIKKANASTTVFKDGQSVMLPGGNDNITLIVINIPGDEPIPDPTLQTSPDTASLETTGVETTRVDTDRTEISKKSPWSRGMKRIRSGLYILLLIIGAVFAFLFFAAPDQLAQGLSSVGINLFAPSPVANQPTQPAAAAAVEPTDSVPPTEPNSVVIVAVTDSPTDTPVPLPSPEQTEPAPDEERLPTVTRGFAPSPTAPPTATLTPTTIPSPTVITSTLITQTGSFTEVDATNLPEPELIRPVPFDDDPTQHNGARGIRFVWRWPGEFNDNLSFQIRMYLPGGDYVGIHNAAELRNEAQFERLDNNLYALTVVLDGLENITQSGADYRWSVALVQIEPEYRWLELESEHRPISLLVPQN